MQKTTLSTQKIKLNGERVTRRYTSEVITKVEQQDKKVFNAIANEFELTFFGQNNEGLLKYKVENKKRLLLNEKLSVIRKLKKAQKIALEAAQVNDVIECRVGKNFKFDTVVNTQEIRQKWKEIKTSLLFEYPDLDKMASDFDWQLREENIQQVFLEDNFYNFFFSNIFYREFKENELLEDRKVITNAIGNITIPILEQKKIGKHDRAFTDVEIYATAVINESHNNFPIAKLNVFLGQLPTKIESKHKLNFEYNGKYYVKPQQGLVTKGRLEYAFEIKNLYKKTTIINFNLEENE